MIPTITWEFYDETDGRVGQDLVSKFDRNWIAGRRVGDVLSRIFRTDVVSLWSVLFGNGGVQVTVFEKLLLTFRVDDDRLSVFRLVTRCDWEVHPGQSYLLTWFDRDDPRTRGDAVTQFLGRVAGQVSLFQAQRNEARFDARFLLNVAYCETVETHTQNKTVKYIINIDEFKYKLKNYLLYLPSNIPN